MGIKPLDKNDIILKKKKEKKKKRNCKECNVVGPLDVDN